MRFLVHSDRDLSCEGKGEEGVKAREDNRRRSKGSLKEKRLTNVVSVKGNK